MTIPCLFLLGAVVAYSGGLVFGDVFVRRDVRGQIDKVAVRLEAPEK